MTSGKFCRTCGGQLRFAGGACERCETGPVDGVSEKSFGVAVALCGVFGIIGVHHFYMGNWIHGLVDFGMFVVAMVLINGGGDPGAVGVGFLVLFVDIIHTLIITYLLIVGRSRDGRGKLILYPGQMS